MVCEGDSRGTSPLDFRFLKGKVPALPMDEAEVKAALLDLDANAVVLSRLYCLLGDDYTDLDSIAELIMTDAQLAARLLRMSNSTFYGSGHPVETVSGAIHKIGLREVVRLVSVLVSRNLYQQDLKAYRLSADAYWILGYFCASFIEWLVQDRVERVPAYLFGLFHSIGYLGVDRVLKQEENFPVRSDDQSIGVWEMATVGFDSARITAQVLEEWGFDQKIATWVRVCTDPDASPVPDQVVCLRLARQIAFHNEFDLQRRHWELPPAPRMLAALDLKEDDVQAFADASLQGVQSMRSRLV